MLLKGPLGPPGPRTMFMALFLLFVASDDARAKIIRNPGLLCSRSPESKALRHPKCNIDNSRNYCGAMMHDCGDFFMNASVRAGAWVQRLQALVICCPQCLTGRQINA